MAARKTVLTISANAVTQGRHVGGSILTAAVIRICSLRCMASTAPAMFSQMNRIIANSSLQTDGESST